MTTYNPGGRTSLVRLVRPRSVALVGASARGGALGNVVLDNLGRFGFAGPVHIVHPVAHELFGHACVARIDDLPMGVDCVVLAIPAAGVLDAVRACAQRQVGGVIVFAAGFAELGDEGRAMQAEMAAIARAAGMAIEGPNCLGFTNYVDGIPLTFSATEPRPLSAPGIAVASQSGAMAVVARGALHGRNLPVSMAVSTGNEAVNGIEDFLALLIEDPMTRVIAMIVEHFRHPGRFLQLARIARQQGKHLVLLHPGQSAAAREAAKTHTGALAGDHAVMRMFVERAGVRFARTLEELLDVSEMLLLQGAPVTTGLAVLGESGAFGAQILDICSQAGLSLPAPSGAAATALGALAPGFILPNNPLDMTAQALAKPELYAGALAALAADPAFGTLMVCVTLTSRAMADRKMPGLLNALKAFSGKQKLIFAMLGDDADIGDDHIAAVRALGVPFYRSPERALRMLATLLAAHVPQSAGAPEPVEPAPRLPSGLIPEHRARDLLGAAGVPVPAHRLVQTVDDALAAAQTLGYPVVLKAQSAALPHKSDAGGVVLGLAGDDALRAGWARMQAELAHNVPGLALDGILVERMAGRGVELIVGARNDPDWGPLLMLGLGGIFTEILHDVRLLPATCSAADIHAALDALKGAALLQGARGSRPADREAIADMVLALAAFVRAHPEIADIEINPLMVYPQGEGVRVLDALINVRPVA